MARMKKEALTKLTDRQYEWLSAEAARMQISIPDVIRRLLDREIDRGQNRPAH